MYVYDMKQDEFTDYGTIEPVPNNNHVVCLQEDKTKCFFTSKDDQDEIENLSIYDWKTKVVKLFEMLLKISDFMKYIPGGLRILAASTAGYNIIDTQRLKVQKRFSYYIDTQLRQSAVHSRRIVAFTTD